MRQKRKAKHVSHACVMHSETTRDKLKDAREDDETGEKMERVMIHSTDVGMKRKRKMGDGESRGMPGMVGVHSNAVRSLEPSGSRRDGVQ